MIKWYFRKLLPIFIWSLIVCKKLDAVAHGDAANPTAVAPAIVATAAAVDATNDEDVQVKTTIKLIMHFHYGFSYFPKPILFK